MRPAVRSHYDHVAYTQNCAKYMQCVAGRNERNAPMTTALSVIVCLSAEAGGEGPMVLKRTVFVCVFGCLPAPRSS
jgi:hypothetical protein